MTRITIASSIVKPIEATSMTIVMTVMFSDVVGDSAVVFAADATVLSTRADVVTAYTQNT